MPDLAAVEEESVSSEDSASGDAALEEGTASRSSRAKTTKKMKKVKTTHMEMLAGGAAVLSVGTSITAMVVNPLTPVFVAGTLSSVIGPYAYYQQTKLTDIRALEETHRAFKEEVERLHRENERLNATVGELSDTIDQLEDVEQALDVITQVQGQSVDAFAKQVKDNRKILDQMHMNLRANVLQNLLQVVIRSDQDGNMQIEEHEIDDLAERMNKINGVEVRKDLFRQKILEDGEGSLRNVMEIIKNLMAEDVPEEEAIFIIRDEPKDSPSKASR